jgi:hypothetical protein
MTSIPHLTGEAKGAEMSCSDTSASAGQLYRFEQRFGPAEARALTETLAAADPGSHFTFDFSDVREFEDVAVGALAEALTGRPRDAVALRGLSLHQRRMLRYFGVDLEAGRGSTTDRADL